MKIHLDTLNQFTKTVSLFTKDTGILFADLKIDTGANTSVIGESLVGLHTQTHDLGTTLSSPTGGSVPSYRVYGYTLFLGDVALRDLSFDVNPVWKSNSDYGTKLLLGMDILQYFDMHYTPVDKTLDIFPNSPSLKTYKSQNFNLIEEVLRLYEY